MGFVIWHYVARLALFTVFPLCVAGFFFEKGTFLHGVSQAALLLFFVLGLAGASLALLILFTPFRFACPRCRQRHTTFGSSKRDGMWLECKNCRVVIREGGFLKVGLRYEEHGHDA
jgi:hypothetical protein